MSKILRLAWFVVLVAVLLVGGWSMFHLLHTRLGLPTLFSVVGAVVFDLAALIFSEYARSAAERGFGFIVPAFFMLLCVAVSSYANATHGMSLGWGMVGGVVFGALPWLLEALFLAHTLDKKGERLEKERKLPQRLPRVGFLAMLLFPGRSVAILKGEVAKRLDAIERTPYGATITIEQATTEPAGALSGDTASAPALPAGSVPTARDTNATAYATSTDTPAHGVALGEPFYLLPVGTAGTLAPQRDNRAAVASDVASMAQTSAITVPDDASSLWMSQDVARDTETPQVKGYDVSHDVAPMAHDIERDAVRDVAPKPFPKQVPARPRSVASIVREAVSHGASDVATVVSVVSQVDPSAKEKTIRRAYDRHIADVRQAQEQAQQVTESAHTGAYL